MWSRTRIGIVVAILAVAGLVAAALWFGPWRSVARDRSPALRAAARSTADELAAAWSEGDLGRVAWAEGSEDPAGSVVLATALLAGDEPLHPTVTVSGVTVDLEETTGRAHLEVSWALTPEHTWTYDTSVALVRSVAPEDSVGGGDDLDHADQGDADPDDGEPRWEVVHAPSLVHPELAAGEVLRLRRVLAPRGDIVDGTGRSLVASAAGSVVVGFRRDRVPAEEDPMALARTVADHLGLDGEELAARVTAAGPDQVVEVTVLSAEDYQRVRPVIHPIPGTVFRTEEGSGDLPEGFARAVLGAVGPASFERARASKGRLREGEPSGLGGVQLGQDAVLGGRAGLVVEAAYIGEVDDAVVGSVRALHEVPAEPGRDVTVTLDVPVQTAADAAVATTEQPSALVAIRVSTGDVVAVANGPTAYGGYNRAMIGSYPPGSVFKVVTTLALLEGGLDPASVIDCPATRVAGRAFGNAGDMALGPVPFRVSFARSCNTAFVGLHGDVDTHQLIDVADRLGYRPLEVGAPVYGGSVPAAQDLAEHAAAMLGQGRVLASPLAVALSSASVAAGRTVIPRLVVDPQSPTVAGEELDPSAVAQLHDLMRLVVTDGTGTALAGVPGSPVHGKTGTAEYGTERPPLTHSWFTGFQDDLAFAVLVENSAGGGAVAAPVAARFLELVARSG